MVYLCGEGYKGYKMIPLPHFKFQGVKCPSRNITALRYMKTIQISSTIKNYNSGRTHTHYIIRPQNNKSHLVVSRKITIKVLTDDRASTYLKLGDFFRRVQWRAFRIHVRSVRRATFSDTRSYFARAQDETDSRNRTVRGLRIRFYRLSGPQYVVHQVSVFGRRLGSVHWTPIVGKSRGPQQEQRRQPRERAAHLARVRVRRDWRRFL